jgi:glycosyltransferase involved in cell wall biosynthesis
MTANLPISADPASQARKQIHVLTLTPFYPHLEDEANGCFIAEPLPRIEKLGITHTVIAVQPFYRKRTLPSRSFSRARWRRFFSLPSGIGLPSAGAFLFASILAEVRELHAANRIQVIHAHSALPCGHAAYLIGKELGIPFAVTVHGLDAYSTNQVSGLSGRWSERVSRMVYRSAQTVVCISEKVREQVLSRMSRVNTAVVYNGVDTKLFSPSTEPTGSQEILSVGTLIPIKGHDLLLRAIADVQSEFPKLSCKIIGQGPERARLVQLAAQLNLSDKVTFVARQTRGEIANAMKRCTVFALPSRYEGLGCVNLEAMATAKPVVACSGQGIDEVIRNGVNGRLVRPDDLEGLSSTLFELLRSPQLRTSLGHSARHTILDGFTLEHQVARLAAIFLEGTK